MIFKLNLDNRALRGRLALICATENAISIGRLYTRYSALYRERALNARCRPKPPRGEALDDVGLNM